MENSIPGFFIILFVIFITGIIGGIRNWAIDGQNEKQSSSILFARIVDALVASASIPLFLSVIGNEKIAVAFGKIRIWDSDYQQAIFILTSFCGLAAIFSQRFLESLSKRVMQLNDKVDKIEKTSDINSAILSTQIESDIQKDILLEVASIIDDSATNEQKIVLNALSSGQFLMRSVSGLSLTTKLSEQDVESILLKLKEIDFVSKLETPKGARWALTDEGRMALAIS